MTAVTHLMLDDVDLSIEERYAQDAYAIAGYVNGRYANWPAIVLRWEKSGKYLVSIDTQANPGAGAQCLDVEKGDATPAQAGQWAKLTREAGQHYRDARAIPKIYVDLSNLKAVMESITAAGLTRADVMIWTAHNTGKAHICEPATCGPLTVGVTADATQWTFSYDSQSLDASLCSDYFFTGIKAPVVELVEVPNVVGIAGDVAVGKLTAAGLKPSPAIPAAGGIVVMQKPDAGGKVEKGTVVVLAVDLPKPPEPPKPPMPAPVVPQPTPAPEPPLTGKPKVLVYVQELLTDATAARLGVPTGSILYIPHEVEAA